MRPSPAVQPPAWPYLAIGAVCGLSWATALRGWMEQLAIGSGIGSTFTWLTEALLLLPATLVGVLLGRAAHHRACGTRAPRLLIWAPALLGIAIADPSIFQALVTTGEGGGSLLVVITALCGGFTLSRRRWTIGRALTALLASLGLLLITAIGSMAAAVQTARGTWVCLLGLSLVLLLSLTAVLPYPPVHPPLAPGWYVALGGLAGFAWAASLRDFMTVLAGPASTFTFTGSFGIILPTGTLLGALLGWAEHRRRTGRPYSLFIPTPLLLGLVPLVITGDGTTPFTLAVLGIIGGSSLSGRGPRTARILAGAVAVADVLVVFLAPKPPGLSATTAYGAWFATLASCLFVILALACAIPMRRPNSITASPERVTTDEQRDTRPVLPFSMRATIGDGPIAPSDNWESHPWGAAGDQSRDVTIFRAPDACFTRSRRFADRLVARLRSTNQA